MSLQRLPSVSRSSGDRGGDSPFSTSNRLNLRSVRPKSVSNPSPVARNGSGAVLKRFPEEKEREVAASWSSAPGVSSGRRYVDLFPKEGNCKQIWRRRVEVPGSWWKEMEIEAQKSESGPARSSDEKVRQFREEEGNQKSIQSSAPGYRHGNRPLVEGGAAASRRRVTLLEPSCNSAVTRFFDPNGFEDLDPPPPNLARVLQDLELVSVNPLCAPQPRKSILKTSTSRLQSKAVAYEREPVAFNASEKSSCEFNPDEEGWVTVRRRKRVLGSPVISIVVLFRCS